MKIVAALWDPDPSTLFDDALRSDLRAAGATRLQVNVDDAHIPEAVLRLQAFDTALTSVVSVWTDGDPAATVDVLRPLADRVAAWQVEERIPLDPAGAADGQLSNGRRIDGLAQVAFLRRPAELPYDAWLAHWHGPHTQIAIETQATFGYVQNRVVATLTDGTPPVDAIVEELFPTEAMHDIHAYYGSAGDQAELDRRMVRLMESVSTMGADRDLDVVATSRYVFDLGDVV